MSCLLEELFPWIMFHCFSVIFFTFSSVFNFFSSVFGFHFFSESCWMSNFSFLIYWNNCYVSSFDISIFILTIHFRCSTCLGFGSITFQGLSSVSLEITTDEKSGWRFHWAEFLLDFWIGDTDSEMAIFGWKSIEIGDGFSFLTFDFD